MRRYFILKIQLFDLDASGNISEHMLRSIIHNFNTTVPEGGVRQESAGASRNAANTSERVQLKFDKSILLKKFDRDEDGAIGRDDFVRIPEKQRPIVTPTATAAASATKKH